jgi:outer membrane protein
MVPGCATEDLGFGDRVRLEVSMSLKWLLRGFASAAVLASVLSVSAHAETLAEALARAYNTNPTLGAERARQRGTDEQVPQALSGWRPTITAQGQAGGTVRNARPSFGGGSYKSTYANPATLDIQLRQPIFDGFRTVEGTKAAEARVKAGRDQLLATEQDVMFRTVQAYMNVIRDRQLLDIRNQNRAVLADQLRGTDQRFQVGEVTRTDVSQAKARVAQAIAAISSAKAQLASSLASYRTLTGHDAGSLSYPKLPKLPRNLDAALAIAHEFNPNLLAAAQVADAASHDVFVARSGLLPSVSLQASANITEDWNNKGGNTKFARIDGVVTVPIYDGGTTYSKVREAKQIASQRQIETIETTRSVRENVTSAWNAYNASVSNISSAQEQVKSAQDALSGVKEEYLVGSRSTIDVLNAQQELLTARTALVQAQRDTAVIAYQVIGTIGKLTARSLALRVRYYDPVTNYKTVRNKLFGTNISGEQ